MRYVALRIALPFVLAACPSSSDGQCEIDDDCTGTALCARTSECLPASQVRAVRVTWTIRGMPASDATCAQTPDLYVMFAGPAIQDTFGYAPVPCRAGLFTIDKFPRRFVSVEIGAENRFMETQALDANGNAAIDLFP